MFITIGFASTAMGDIDTTYAVIGGGIVGASIAYHLSERTDEPITVFERQAISSETTYKSMAMYGLYGDEIQYRMKQYGLELYNRFFEDPRALPKADLAGRLAVATTEDGARELERGVRDLAETSGLSGTDRDLLEYIDGNELRNRLLVPGLNADSIEGAAFRPRVWFVNPQELAHEFVERARENGVRFETGVNVTEVLTDNGRVSGLETDSGEVAVETVVCAAGPWNVALARNAGIELPVRHTLAPILKLDSDERAAYSLPAIEHHESPFAIYRQRARDRGSMYVGYYPVEPTDTVEQFLETYDVFEPDTMGELIPKPIRDGMLDAVERLLPSLMDADIVDEWVGVRSVTPDGNPVVGWTEIEGFSIAAFHTSGIQLAPKVGDVIARQLVDAEPTDLYDALSVSRFEGYTDRRTEPA